VTLGDFVGALRSSKVRHHRRIAEKVPQQGQVIRSPGLEMDRGKAPTR
jgi:hypothetical protein